MAAETEIAHRFDDEPKSADIEKLRIVDNHEPLRVVPARIAVAEQVIVSHDEGNIPTDAALKIVPEEKASPALEKSHLGSTEGRFYDILAPRAAMVDLLPNPVDEPQAQLRTVKPLGLNVVETGLYEEADDADTSYFAPLELVDDLPPANDVRAENTDWLVGFDNEMDAEGAQAPSDMFYKGMVELAGFVEAKEDQPGAQPLAEILLIRVDEAFPKDSNEHTEATKLVLTIDELVAGIYSDEFNALDEEAQLQYDADISRCIKQLLECLGEEASEENIKILRQAFLDRAWYAPEQTQAFGQQDPMHERKRSDNLHGLQVLVGSGGANCAQLGQAAVRAVSYSVVR